MTASTLARQCGLTRSTLLYYESRGLLRRPPRTPGNYREYTDADLRRLQQICLYRKVGLSLAEIRSALGGRTAGPVPRGTSLDAAAVLERRLKAIDDEIEQLRGHQRAILRLLRQSRVMKGTKMITKDKWVAIMRAAGLTEDDMQRWHREFEKNAPAEHQEFLEFLHIPAEEIATIREWSRRDPRR